MSEEIKPTKIATTLEEAIPLISDRVAADGDDWRVKVFRRASMVALNETLAIFDNATAEQILSPEPWLSRFAGGSGRGGFYSLRVVHSKDRTADRPTAIFQIPSIPGDPLAPNPKIVREPGWNGPPTLTYPDEIPAPSKKNGAVPWSGSPDSPTRVPRHPADDAGGGTGPLLAELQREREKLAEERHRMEMDSVRREAEADRKRMDQRIADLAAKLDRPQVIEPRQDPMETISKVIAAVGAAFAPVIPMFVESRKAAAEAEAKRMERESIREEKREARESALMEKIATQSSESAKVIGVFTESLSTVARSMVQTVAMVGELRGGEPQDDGIMGVLKAGISAWAEAQARAPAPPPQQALPQHPVAPRPPPPAPVPTAAEPAADAPGTEEVEVSPSEMVDMLADSIRSRTDEKELAPDIVEAFGEPEFISALKAEGGILPAIKARLGEEWAQDAANVAYIQRLFTIVDQIAVQKGMDLRALFAV